MKIKNRIGASQLEPPRGYNSWLEYWKEKTATSPNICSSIDCNRTDIRCVQVQKALSNDNHNYIVPLCMACQHRPGIFEIEAPLLAIPNSTSL
jgi:Zn finger protein HypA/HybF involved in hydrogenase expression